MKRNLFSTICALLIFVTGFSQSKLEQNTKKPTNKKENVVVSNGNLTKKQVKELRKKHAYYLANNKINKTFALSRSERKAAGLPPNKYQEQEWLMTMNPALGRPTPDNLGFIRAELEKTRNEALSGRIVGDGVDNLWQERGPNNVGGRTKAMIFDPTDATGNTVIAGGVSGGLWKNTNITSAATVWTRIATLPEHLNVQNITVDPNNSSTWYVGTGESYTGDANGNGIWKTTNAGTSWTRVFGGGTVSSTQSASYNLNIFAPSNAGVIRGYITALASFGAPVASLGANRQIVLVNDGTAGNNATTGYPLSTEGCAASAAGYFTGKIALIRRGTCTFEAKALEAENAGAVGVIIMNNAPGAGAVGMASSSLGATVPTVMISKEDGDLLVANLTNLTGNFAATAPGAFTGTAVSGIQYINDIAIKNNGGVSEIYAAVGDSFNGGYINSSNYGLFKSVDGGTNWTGPLSLPVTASGNKTCPFDLEVAVGGTVWVSTTDSSTFGDGGGKIFSSTNNGATWTLKHTIVGNGGGARVEIEASNTTADVIYVCSQLNQADTAAPTIEVQLLKTTNGFTTAPSVLSLPAGDEGRETTYGFTGAQAFYDMMIEVDPTNDAIVYVGGIDLYRSANSGASWTGISNWMADVHSDQHAMAFKPGTPNAGIFGNDGGVYYTASLSGTTATSRNSGFNVTQFVGVAVSPTGVTGLTNDFFVAGAQDNGSNYFPSSLSTTTGVPTGTVSGSTEVQGGDGGIPLFKQNATSSATSYYVTNYVYNDQVIKRGLNGATQKTLSSGVANRGLFYPAMTLDSANDIVYSDFTDGTNRVYTVRRYSAYTGGPAPLRVDLTYPTLFTAYPTALRPGKATATTLYVGTSNSKLLKLTNANTVTAANSTAGTGWSDISVGSGFVGTISDIEFGATDLQIFVTLKNYGTTNVWYTLNGGTNWYSIEGDLPDMPVHTILQNPLNANEVMIGTELGVWYANTFNPATSATQALNWRQAYNGMSGVKVTDLDLQPNSPTAPTAYNVFAATYGRGVFSGPLTAAPLSTKENDIISSTFNVYPTVSNGNITILSGKYFGQTKLNVFDISGKNVFSNTIDLDSSEQKINLGNLSSGNYILKISGENFEGTKKLIIE
ncbi:Por secretion system C-terminal sorting domain-containing protein [Flavobacterium swingsii]|uniref:Por secretion system C-terminal sorting domain-containing protein n=1 Tax=Flavobacterium swingsii TaxID=498292 RepID=A0A1I0XRY7_9FLAO|nr:PA domain-containing protein [Flavobacterium swingsii]SFB02723.1 Por secretion system C-terminal sorting domain-containing protein [Flavobacterium swingsii]